MPRPRFVLSTVGISLLNNFADDNTLKKKIVQLSNAQTIPADLHPNIDALCKQIPRQLDHLKVALRRQKSAELNGLYGLYENKLDKGKDDIHYLIATDTELGRRAADILKNFLEAQGLSSVQIHIPKNLSSDTPQRFSDGIKNLIYWCEETIPGYREQNYSIIFNLTGGFKSLQGYLNVVGMLYADEIVYIFESSNHLLRIPRLPLRIDIDTLKSFAVEMALMEHGYLYPKDKLANMPESMLEEDDKGNVTLSNWGILIWNHMAKEVFTENLLNFPRLEYSDQFRKDFRNATPQEKIKIQEVLSKVSCLLEENQGNPACLKQDGGLQYDNYTSKHYQGKPLGHFRVNDERRISCIADSGTLILRRYGAHNEVNNNP
jgi:putative CRISPR-associated protein (TIGR02619 family)